LIKDLLIRDWTRQNRTWFAAVQLEKRMMFIILTLIVAVAAFNLVSHPGDDGHRQARRHRHPAHAGGQPAQHHGDFHGAGRDGGRDRHAARACCWAWASPSTSTPSCRPSSRAAAPAFCRKDIYLISNMPSDPQRSDILPIAVISLILSFLATIYPSWRASRVNPAEALRYE
jgi:lipoprotein-releasing system permease protein